MFIKLSNISVIPAINNNEMCKISSNFLLYQLQHVILCLHFIGFASFIPINFVIRVTIHYMI